MHPGQDELRAYAAGRLPPDATERVERHLLECDECGRRLDDLDLGHDPLVRALRIGQEEKLAGAPDLPERFGRYEILAEVGRGGMGVVYRAFDPRLQRTVALKVIAPGRPLPPEHAPRFRREAEAAARLQHANIVQIFDFGEHEGTSYCAFEFAEGGGLDRVLAAGPMRVREAAEIAALLADAVEYAHRRRVIHRDLKPSNVLLAGDGTPKIADFGLCKVLDDDPHQTIDGTLMGSPSYMAPEQARGRAKEVGPAADVYALGAIFYQMLTGRPPFCGGSLEATLLDVLEKDPPRPSRLRPEVDRDSETICLKCLHKQPAHRYPTAAALAADLRRFLDGTPILARTPSLAERAVKLARRYPASTALAALLASSAVLFVLLLTGYSLRLKRTTADLQQTSSALRLRLEESRRSAFALKLQQAAALAQADPDEARQLLLEAGRSDPELRDFTCRHLLAQADRRLPPLGHSGDIRALAFSPAANRLAAGGKDGKVTLWSPAGSAKPVVIATHPKAVMDLAFSPGTALLATASEDGTAAVWDGEGRRLAAIPAEAQECNAVCFSPDGTRLATGYAEGAVRVWRHEPVKLLQSLEGHRKSVVHLCFNSDGTFLASASKDETIRIWSATTWQPLFELKVPLGYATSIRFHPARPGLLAAACNDRTLRLWQIEPRAEPKIVDELRGFQDTPSSVAFSAGGERIAVGSYDNSVRVWKSAAQAPEARYRPLAVYRADQRVNAVVFDGQGVLRAGLGDGRLLGWTPQPDATTTIAADAFSPPGIAYLSGRRALASVSGDGVMSFWNDQSGQQLARQPLGTPWISSLSSASEAACLAWLCRGRISTARVQPGWRLDVKVLADCGATALALSPDGRRLAAIQPLTEESRTGAAGGFAFFMGATLYDVAGGRRLWTAPGETTCLAFSPQGALLAACRGGVLRVVGRDGREQTRWSSTAGQDLRAVAISPDGSRLAAACQTGQILLCRTADDTLVLRLHRQGAGTLAVAFSPDGKTLASGGIGGQIHLWDPVTGPERGQLAVPRDVMRLAFAPDSNALAALTEDGSIHVWHAGPAGAALGHSLPGGRAPD